MVNSQKLLININDAQIAIVGLGYVGLPLAIEFSKKFSVTGYDKDKKRIDELNRGIDRTNEITKKQLNKNLSLKLTSKKTDINRANVYIITVPTPVDKNNNPDLNPLINASELVGKFLTTNDIVIYESTVFPGCTEQICVPILEKQSKLKYNKEFSCGYSPERINPGDKKHTLTKIVKVTSGSNPRTSNFVDNLYKVIISAGTYKASSIAVAEAAKVIENTQRDVNIALMNELSIIFNKLKLDTKEVLDAAKTKWNFLPFQPGLVGGHCIGVDPYYLTYKAIEVGYSPEIILAGRNINDNMDGFILDNLISYLEKNNIDIKNSKVAILGITFKENCPDLRNSKVINIITKLREYNTEVLVVDDWVNKEQAKALHNIDLISLDEIRNVNAAILAVGHDNYKSISLSAWENIILKNGILLDVKSVFDKDFFKNSHLKHWRL